MTDYCSPGDLYAFGMPRGAAPNPGRVADGASSSTNAIALDGHGFDADDPVFFRAEGNGALPAPLVEHVEYYADPLTEATFRVRAAPGGSAIDLSSTGSRIVVIAPAPVGAAISWASRVIDEMLGSAHATPLSDPIPEIVRMTAAELAAGKLLGRSGAASKSITAIVDEARKRLERWSRGVPLKGANVPTRANLAATAASPFRDPRGWGEHGGL